MLDSQRIIQYNINCTDAGGNQDYMIMKEKMQGNTYQNSNIYKYNWFWCESFDGMKLIEHNDSIIAGIPIDNIERKYDVNLQTANAAYTYYVFGVVQRELKITPLGIQLT